MKNLFLATMVMTTLLAVSWQTALAQNYGGSTGTNADTYIINRDDTDVKAVLRLQSKYSAGLLEHDNNRLRWRWANGTNKGSFGTEMMSLDPHGCLYVVRAVDGGNARMGALYSNDPSANFYNKALSNHSGNIALKQDNNGTTHLNSSGGRVLNFKQGNVTRMYLETNGNVRVNNSLTVNSNFLSNNHVSLASGNGKGFRFWNSDHYKIHMGNTSAYKYGPVQDYAIKMNMSSNANRGWVWGVLGQTPVAALSNTGNMKIKGTFETEGSMTLNQNLTVKNNLYMDDGDVRDVHGLYLKDWDDNSGGNNDKYRLLARDGAWMYYNGGVVVGGYGNNTWSDVPDGRLIVKERIGVGLTGPTEKLEVRGYGKFSNNTSNYIKIGHGGSNSFLDHKGAGNMVFRFSGSDKMTLTSTGKLSLTKHVTAGNTHVGPWHNGNTYASFQHSSLQATNNAYALLQSSDGHTFVNAANGKVLHFRQANGDRMRIEGNGNVTVNKSMTVHDNLTVNRGAKLVVQGYQNGGAGRGIYMWTHDNPHWGIYMGQSGNGRALDGSAAVAGYGFSSHAIRFRSNSHSSNGFIWENGSDKLLMSLRGSDGLAYIAGKLDVKGSIRTSEIEVLSTSSWPDYVFADDYALPTLESVESHIKSNKHLPGVPSEAEVMEEGINLGEMDAVLLQKVEELTLYLIEQNKQLATQNERLAAQNQRIAELEQKLTQKED